VRSSIVSYIVVSVAGAHRFLAYAWGADQASALLTLGDTYEKSYKACLAHRPRSCAGGDRKELRHDQEWANHHPGHERPDGGCHPDHGQHLHRADRASHGERENRHDLDRRSRQDPVLFTPDAASKTLCTGRCAQTWPPLLFTGTGKPTASTALLGE
jgi:hypothetical protein